MYWLKENLQIKKNPELALKNLERQSKKNLKESSLIYETGENKEKNIIYAEMTRTPDIEKQSIAFITNLMEKTLNKSKSSKIKDLLIYKKS